MKRSAQIGLLVMGTLGVTTASGVWSATHDQACDQRAQQAGQDQTCRRSVWSSSGHGSGGGSRAIYGNSSSSNSVAPTTPASSPSAQRGGFGGFASRIGGFFSGS